MASGFGYAVSDLFRPPTSYYNYPGEQSALQRFIRLACRCCYCCSCWSCWSCWSFCFAQNDTESLPFSLCLRQPIRQREKENQGRTGTTARPTDETNFPSTKMCPSLGFQWLLNSFVLLSLLLRRSKRGWRSRDNGWSRHRIQEVVWASQRCNQRYG